MGTYIIILVCMIVCYFVLNLMMHTLPEVEAGPTSGIRSTGCQRVPSNIPASYEKKEADGALTIHRNFIVKGKCMKPKGINEGIIVDVRMLNKTERSHLKDNLSSGDIVLIYLNDRRFRGYKLRIIKEIRQNDTITFYYNHESEQKSSKLHLLKDIIGFVEM